MYTLIQVIASLLALISAAFLLPGVNFTGSWWHLVLAGVIIGVINLVTKPFLKAIWPSFIYVTLAIFTLLINASLLVFVALLVPGLAIAGFWTAIWALIIISLTNYSLHTIINYHQ